MKPLHYLLPFLCFAAATLSRAQLLPGKVLMNDQRILDVRVHPRKPGTSQIRVGFIDQAGEQTLNLADVAQIAFDLSAFHPQTLEQLYLLGRTGEVIDTLKGRIIPYFGFVDQNANSNDLVKLFIRALYREDNHPGVILSATEVDKYTPGGGDVHRMAHLYKALSYLETGKTEEFNQLKPLFAETDRNDPHAPIIWYGQAKAALLEEDWETAYPALAKIITEAPMDTDWAPEALYLSAVHHHSQTNLVVANQICQEIAIVAPLTDWPDKAIELETKIDALAKELGIELVEWGGFRENEGDGEGESKIDYRERQRALEREETERLLRDLNEEDTP